MKTRLLFSLAFLLHGVVACDSAPGFKSKAKNPADVAGAPVGKTQTTAANMPRYGSAAGANLAGQKPAVFAPNVTLSDMIVAACGIAPRPGNAAMQASFEFDSAALSQDDRQLLGDVARCLTDGALRGRKVALVGRADARGEPEYNMTLGESRADAVLRYMVDLGVGHDRMNATSRGEMDATGTDEDGMRKDRRVDVELAD